MQSLRRARNHAAADASAHHLAGRQHPQDRRGLRNPEPSASFRFLTGRNGVKHAGLVRRIMDHHGRARNLRARRQPEGRHDSFEIWLLLEEWNALYRERRTDRVFSRHEIARWQHMDPAHTVSRRSGISGSAVHRELSIQKASRRVLVEPHSLLGEVESAWSLAPKTFLPGWQISCVDGSAPLNSTMI